MTSQAEPNSEVGATSHSGDEAVLLGAAATFAVLGGSAVTNTGLSVINGDVGVSPGTSVTGFPPGIVNGAIYVNTDEADKAQAALTTAYNDAAGRTCGTNLTGSDLGTVGILSAGVYCYNSAALLNGTLTLRGGADDVFIFQIPTQLTTGTDSAVSLIGGAQACNIFWQVGTLADIGVRTKFVGTILAGAAVTMKTGATLEGRALASVENVTLDTNKITTPSCTTGGGDDGGGDDGGGDDGGGDDGGGDDGGGDDGTDGGTTPNEDGTTDESDGGDDTPGAGNGTPDGAPTTGNAPGAIPSAAARNTTGSPLRLASGPLGARTEAGDLFALTSATGGTTAAATTGTGETTAAGTKSTGGLKVAGAAGAELPRTGSSVPVEQTLAFGLGLLLVGMLLTSVANARIRVSTISRKAVPVPTTLPSGSFFSASRRSSGRLNRRISTGRLNRRI